jgi:hypothetical protein
MLGVEDIKFSRPSATGGLALTAKSLVPAPPAVIAAAEDIKH